MCGSGNLVQQANRRKVCCLSFCVAVHLNTNGDTLYTTEKIEK